MATFIDNLRREFLTCTINGFKLENDLRNLEKVKGCGASDAVVFYCARIHEFILTDAHEKYFGTVRNAQEKKPKLAEIEKALFDYNLIQDSKYYWAKGLRLLGNDVRHSLRRATVEEADSALLFLEFILKWYFCEFPLGQNQATIYKGPTTFANAAGNLLLNLAWTLDSSKLDSSKLKAVFGPYEQNYMGLLSKNFVFPLLLIEIFMKQGDHDSAGRIVDAITNSGRKAKGSLYNRFLQLKGLHLSRLERFDDALAVLEREFNRQKNDRVEDETVGILAGVYKRIWRNSQDQDFLSKSHETYRWGWRKSKNPYLGINAATTALWLNNINDARQIAGETKATLNKRRTMICKRTDSRYDLNYWDMVTLAEAHLLASEMDQAKELYSRAFTTYCNDTENISVTKKQIASIIEHLPRVSNEILRLATC